MSAIYLDPEAMDATAGAVREHAREVDAAVAALETTCSADVPPSLAGWLADELHDIAATARLASLLYAVAALDTAVRAQEVRADQSLASVWPALDAPPLGDVVASYDPVVLLGTAVVTGTRPSDTTVTFVDPGPLVVGAAPAAVGIAPASSAVTLVHPGPLVLETRTPVVGVVGNPTYENHPFVADAIRLQDTNPAMSAQLAAVGVTQFESTVETGRPWTHSRPGATYVGHGNYMGSDGRVGSIASVYPDPHRPGEYEVRP